ncbi:MAG: hypothetical protein OEM32_11780, partial [Acidimicrobiia bacterium]|nr:hypothetical protein [Acidimicrobiia bacterium]
LTRKFVAAAGKDTAVKVNLLWQEGLEFYAGLSTESNIVVARDSGMDAIVWSSPNLILAEILKVVEGGD